MSPAQQTVLDVLALHTPGRFTHEPSQLTPEGIHIFDVERGRFYFMLPSVDVTDLVTRIIEGRGGA